MNPMLLINFKTYRNGTGRRTLNLAGVAEDVALETGINICIAVETPSIYMASKVVSIPVFAQHIDCVDFGPHTGHILAESVREHGAYGAILNHSEKRIENIAGCLKKCMASGLKSVVCVSGISEAKKTAKLNPDYIAFENPELIGSRKSVSRYKPELLKQFINELTRVNRHVIPLCGAGISSGDDVERALQLGLEGVLVSSSVVNSNRPKEKILELAMPMKNFG